MVVIQDSLVTVIVTNVGKAGEAAAVHVGKYVLILAPEVTLVSRDGPIWAEDAGQEDCRVMLRNYHRLAE
jgi:hypothetical protein